MSETLSAEALYDKGLARWYAGDKASAIALYEQAAEAGSPTAAATLSRLYERGDGVDADPAAALKWQTRAAENGDADEMIALGDRYRWGRGVPVDEDEAFKWYIEATHKRSAVAALRVSDIWSTRAARSNRPRDFIAAFRWCSRAAAKGLVDAMDKLALLYYRGEGVGKDLARAQEWFETAAAEGSETAQLCLEALDFAEPAPEIPEIDFTEEDDTELEDLLELDDDEPELTDETLTLYPIGEDLFRPVLAVLARSFCSYSVTPFYDGDGNCFIGADCSAETFRRIYARARMEVLSRETGDFCVTAEEAENETYLRALLSFAGKGTYVVCDGNEK